MNLKKFATDTVESVKKHPVKTVVIAVSVPTVAIGIYMIGKFIYLKYVKK